MYKNTNYQNRITFHDFIIISQIGLFAAMSYRRWRVAYTYVNRRMSIYFYCLSCSISCVQNKSNNSNTAPSNDNASRAPCVSASFLVFFSVLFRFDRFTCIFVNPHGPKCLLSPNRFSSLKACNRACLWSDLKILQTNAFTTCSEFRPPCFN